MRARRRRPRQAPPGHEYVLDGRRAVVLGREELGMIGVECVLGAVFLLPAEAEEALHGGVAMRAVQPFARGSPLELRGLGRLG